MAGYREEDDSDRDRARRRPPRRSARPAGRRVIARQPPAARRRRLSTHRLPGAARTRLQQFRQASLLAVAVTAGLLLIFESPATVAQVDSPVGESAIEEPTSPEELPTVEEPPADLGSDESLQEATSTVRDLFQEFIVLLPKLLIALVLILLALLLSSLARSVLRRLSGRWEKIDAISALVRVGLVVLAIGAGLSVIAGDARALVGSVGFVGLALSWALQTPIESFTGWVLNAFHSYYRRGDRIEVGGVLGDVYRIDILTTTVWEVGGPGKSVEASQSTGALITFPNWEVLRSNIVNYSRDFPYIWDEVTVSITNESDLRYAVDLLRGIADQTVGGMMKQPAEQYRRVLERERLAFDVGVEPQVYLSVADAWTNCTVRYLVPVRERRRWSSALLLAISEELARPEHSAKVRGAYPRTVVDINGPPDALNAASRDRSGGSADPIS